MTQQCPKCDAWLWSWLRTPHVCPPEWEVREATETDDEYRVVHASDAKKAVEKYCDNFDPDFEMSILRNGGTQVFVRAKGSDKVLKFAVEAETVPSYIAREIKT